MSLIKFGTDPEARQRLGINGVGADPKSEARTGSLVNWIGIGVMATIGVWVAFMSRGRQKIDDQVRAARAQLRAAEEMRIVNARKREFDRKR